MESLKSAENLLKETNKKYWNDLFGDIEQKHLGSPNSWASETFIKNFLSNNVAGVRFAVKAVIDDCLSELEVMLVDGVGLDDEDLYGNHLEAESLLKSDVAQVFGFLVCFVQRAALKGIAVDEAYRTKLKALKPQVLSYQEDFEAYTIAKIEKALGEARGKAHKMLEVLDI